MEFYITIMDTGIDENGLCKRLHASVRGSPNSALKRNTISAARVDNQRVVTNRPLAGTRRRGATPEEDFALERELLKDGKECAEHVMLVDLGRNDVGKVAEHGSVQVRALWAEWRDGRSRKGMCWGWWHSTGACEGHLGKLGNWEVE